jgi:hypothetical protein
VTCAIDAIGAAQRIAASASAVEEVNFMMSSLDDLSVCSRRRHSSSRHLDYGAPTASDSRRIEITLARGQINSLIPSEELLKRNHVDAFEGSWTTRSSATRF